MPTKFKTVASFVGDRANNPYPSPDQDPALKRQDEFIIAYGRAMMADYTNNYCAVPYSFGPDDMSFKILHEYATGTHSNEKLKDQAIGKGPTKKKDGKHITKSNIAYTTLPVLPKMFDVMREKNMPKSYDVDAYCIDDDSIQAKAVAREMLKYLVDDDTKELLQKTKFKPNLPLDPAAIGLVTSEDVDLYFETGNYPFERELASIACCNKTKLVSNYKVIQDTTFDDLIKFGIAAWKSEIDHSTKTVKIRKVSMYDPELGYCPAIIPHSVTPNYESMPHFGEIRKLNVSQLRKECPSLNAQQIIYLVKCFDQLNTDYKGLISQASATGDCSKLSKCSVLVLDFQFLSEDIEKYVKNDSRNFFKPVPFDFELSKDRKRKGDKHIEKKVIVRYEGLWPIGTDILLKGGASNDNIYYGPDGDRCPPIDYFATRTDNISLVARCVTIQDDIDLANVKLRNSLAAAIPSPRMIIQQQLLDNVFLNNIKQAPEDNVATMRELGYLFVNAFDDDGRPLFPGQKMVDFLPMGIQEDINVFSGQILAGINNIREVLGIAQGADGSTPQKYDGVKKTELSAQSSNAALFPTFNCYQYLFEAGFVHVVKMWQLIAKDTDIKVDYSPLGRKNMKILSLDEKFTNSDLNIVLTIGATDQQLAELLADIKQMKALGVQTNFAQGITTSEYIYLYETIMSGNPKQAMWVMAKVEQKKIAAQQAVDAQNQKANELSQRNSAAQAELNRQQTEKTKGSENRLTIMLSEAEKRKTIIVEGMLKTFDTTVDETPTELYERMMKEVNTDIAMALSAAAPSPSQQQPDPEEQQAPQQMVA